MNINESFFHSLFGLNMFLQGIATAGRTAQKPPPILPPAWSTPIPKPPKPRPLPQPRKKPPRPNAPPPKPPEKRQIESKEEATVNKEYAKMQKKVGPIQAQAPTPTTKSRIKAGFNSIANIGRNVYDSTVGYGVAKGQNWKSRRYLKKNPGTDKDIVYLINGIYQNMGSQHRLSREFRKKGLVPYHIQVNHGKTRKENAGKFYKQTGDMHNKTKLKNVPKRTDAISGHSSGGDLAIYLAGEEKTSRYGVNPVSKSDKETIQARAPAPYGVKPRTLGQRLIMAIAPDKSDLYTVEGRKNAVEMYKRKPRAPITIHSGLNDRLVTPDLAYEKHAAEINVIDHPDSTHFGTAGGNKNMNQYFANRLAERHELKKQRRAEENYAYN